MRAGMEARSGEPWYEDAKEAIELEQVGDWVTDEELAGLAMKEFPLYFAVYGDREQAYLTSLEGEIPCGDALRLFNNEIFATFDLRPDLARITAPALVITGEDDFITGPVCAHEIADGVAGSELVLLPDCGHFVFVEQPERFAEAVASFLA